MISGGAEAAMLGGAAVNMDEVLFAYLLLASCCVAWFLTGVGDPCLKGKKINK